MTLAFPNYSPARFAVLEKELAAKGFYATGNSGEVKEFGAEVRYDYDGAERLTLTILHAPHFHSMSGFAADLVQAVNAVPEQS